LSGFELLRLYSSEQKMTESQTLLSLYTRTGSESAFRELVSRYIDLVYSTAFRLVGEDAQAAQDVAQTVFVALADKAGTLPQDVMLGGWLHQHTRFVAGDLMRTERRRRLRERQAAEMNAIEDHSESNLAQVAPVLDEAIGQLDTEDRTAILLRFFERKDFRGVGDALGSSEDAARKRVDRALEKLHVLLKHRGATLSAAALGTALATEAVTAAPVGLVTTISSAVVLTGTTIATTATAFKTIAMTTLQKAIIGAALAAAVGTGIYEARQASAWRTQAQTIQGQQSEQMQQLQSERDNATHQLAAVRDEIGRLNRSTSELLKLRNELAQLKSAAIQQQNDPTESARQSWLARVTQLKKYLTQMPDKGIPELKYLTETDWLDTLRTSKLDTEIEARQALNALRNVAKEKVASLMSEALKQYLKSNDGKFPTDTAQLKPYFESPMDDAILGRYTMLPASDVTNMGLSKQGSDWLIAEKAPVDIDYDTRFVTGAIGRGRSDFDADVLIPVVRAFQTANSGQQLGDPSQLLPYVQTPDQQRALQKWIQRFPSLQK
jgi:RNA polymerase sigma factor (sigma-70 family)